MVEYYKNANSYFKVNHTLKRVTELHYGNRILYHDYEKFINDVDSLTKTDKAEFKHSENEFYISKPFTWEFENSHFKTSSEDIVWTEENFGTKTAQVFHNGQIWKACYYITHYPTLYLSRLDVNGEKKSKWINAKYVQNFKINDEISDEQRPDL